MMAHCQGSGAYLGQKERGIDAKRDVGPSHYKCHTFGNVSAVKIGVCRDDRIHALAMQLSTGESCSALCD